MTNLSLDWRPLARGLAAAALAVAAFAGRAAAAESLTPAAGSFRTGGPVLDGTRVTADLPASMHLKNTGGLGRGGPGTGAGLCVPTSVEDLSYWHHVEALKGFQQYLTNFEGGSWPEKLARDIDRYCRHKGVPAPPFVQHTGGDEAFLDRAIKTGRAVGVTYAGSDGYYSGDVAHMVVLVHLDAQRACIADNNRPGVFVWMTRAEFLDRWRRMGGGWAVVLLAPPPPPYSRRPAAVGVIGTPPDSTQPPAGYPTPWTAAPAAAAGGQWARHAQTGDWHWWVGGRCTAVLLADGVTCVRADAGGNPTAVRGPRPDAPAALPAPAAGANYGIELPRLTGEKRYWVGATEVTQAQAAESFGAVLPDDSDRFNVTLVGPMPGSRYTPDERTDAIRAALDALPAGVRERVHVQCYPDSCWQVEQFALKPGLTVREPAVGRVGSEVLHLAAADCDPADLAELVAAAVERRPVRRPLLPLPFNPFAPALHQLAAALGTLAAVLAGAALALYLTAPRRPAAP